MTSPAGGWRIRKIANSARRTLADQDIGTHERILLALDAMQADPFGGDVKKIRGKEDLFRLRVESYRIYYRLDRKARAIEVLLIDKRGQIKDKSIERL